MQFSEACFQSFDINFAFYGKMIEAAFDFNLFQLERSTDGSKAVTVLSSRNPCRRFSGRCAAFERFVKFFDFPPSSEDCHCPAVTEGCFAACRIPDTGTSVFVFKDFFCNSNRKIKTFQPYGRCCAGFQIR